MQPRLMTCMLFQNPYDGRRDSVPASCPLTQTDTVACGCPPTYTFMHSHTHPKINVKKREREKKKNAAFVSNDDSL